MTLNSVSPARYDVIYRQHCSEVSKTDSVGVVVLCYNQSKYVIRCFDGVLAQSYVHIHYVIVDDCSQDDSIAHICECVMKSRRSVVVIRNRYNQHVSAAINNAMELLDTEYLSIIAMDDEWCVHKIARQIETLSHYGKEYAAVYSDAECVSESGVLLKESFIQRNGVSGEMPQGEIFSRLLRGNFIPAHSLLIRMKAIRSLGPFDERLVYEDWDMWLRLSYRMKIAYDPVVMVKYHIVANSITQQHLNDSSVRWYEANYYIYSKWVSALEDPELRDFVLRKVKKTSKWLYMLNSPLAVKALARCIVLDIDLDVVKYFVRAMLPGRSERTRRRTMR